MSYLWQSSRQRETVRRSCRTWYHTKVYFRAALHMFHDCALLWSPYPNMKRDLVGKYVYQQVGVSADSVKHVTGETVTPWVLLWFQLLQNLHLLRIETLLFSENLMHGCSWHLQFLWSPANRLPCTSDERHTDVLYILIGHTPLAYSLPFQDALSLQKFGVPCSDLLCVWCCSLITTAKLLFDPHNGLQLRTPHDN
jgi:hypothetical protein